MKSKLEQALIKSHPIDGVDETNSLVTFSRHTDLEQLKETVEPLSEKQLSQKKIIYPAMKDRVLLNEFRDVRTKLNKRLGERGTVTLVTSALPNSGTSFVATNLAAVIAHDHAQTSLLIDCNLNRPSLHKTFAFDGEAGLSEFLIGDTDNVSEIIHPTGIKRMRYVPVGNKYETGREFFTGSRMRQLAIHLRDRYNDRSVIIDAPAVLESADTRMLVDMCDQVVLVVGYAKVSGADIKEAVDTVGHDKLAGVFFNQSLMK